MTRKHDEIFDDVLSGLGKAVPGSGAAARENRFLKRSNALGERLSGTREEKTLLWVDPGECRMWEGHNRDYALLNEETCRDLIDGIRAQGRQEFPAIVRRIDPPEGDLRYEVVCGARRHFAVNWLRANGYRQFRYLIEIRALTDEEAFRLADIENRDRDDISDYERARDYARAIDAYYGGRQRRMAERLEVSEAWLSRYLNLARLPHPVVDAFPTIRDIRELHARRLKPLLAEAGMRRRLLAEARTIAAEQGRARNGQGEILGAAQVVARLKGAAEGPRPDPDSRLYRRSRETLGVTARRKGRAVLLEVPDGISRSALETALAQFVAERFAQED